MRGLEARAVLAHSRIACVFTMDGASKEQRELPFHLAQMACEMAYADGVRDALNDRFDPPAFYLDPTDAMLLRSWEDGQRMGMDMQNPEL